MWRLGAATLRHALARTAPASGLGRASGGLRALASGGRWDDEPPARGGSFRRGGRPDDFRGGAAPDGRGDAYGRRPFDRAAPRPDGGGDSWQDGPGPQQRGDGERPPPRWGAAAPRGGDRDGGGWAEPRRRPFDEGRPPQREFDGPPRREFDGPPRGGRDFGGRGRDAPPGDALPDESRWGDRRGGNLRRRDDEGGAWAGRGPARVSDGRGRDQDAGGPGFDEGDERGPRRFASREDRPAPLDPELRPWGEASRRPPPRDPEHRPWDASARGPAYGPDAASADAGARAGPAAAAEGVSPPVETDLRVHRLYVTCAPGLEAVVAAELAGPRIRALNVAAGKAGVSCEGTWGVAYRANLWLRSGIRVLMLLAAAPLRSQERFVPAGQAVYEWARRHVDWPALLTAHGRRRRNPLTFSVRARVWSCNDLTSEHLAAVRIKDAACDACKDALGEQPARPDGPEGADLPLYVSFFQEEVKLYRDTSGLSLHKRGYRAVMHRASLNEAVAAGLLQMAGWPQQVEEAAAAAAAAADAAAGGASGGGGAALAPSAEGGAAAAAAGTAAGAADGDEAPAPMPAAGGVLLDPMCGSGTFLIEAGLMAAHRAPGLLRARWPFELWHDHDAGAWQLALDGAAAAARPLPPGIVLMGNDAHPGAVILARRDAAAAGIPLILTYGDVAVYTPPAPPGTVVVNPPWGVRLLGEEGPGSGPAGAGRDADADEAAGPEGAEGEPGAYGGGYGGGGGGRGDGFDASGGEAGTEPATAAELTSTWTSLGRFLKAHCRRADVWVLSGNDAVTRELCMRAERRWPLKV